MKHEVLVETSVVMGASLYSTRQDLATFKDDFFDRSMILFRFLKRHRDKRIGLVTQTIEDQASDQLEKAMIRKLKEDLDPTTLSVLLDCCWDRLEEILQILVKENTDQQKVLEKVVAIVSMYKHLKDRASLITPSTVRAAVKNTIDHIASRKFRGLASEIHQKQWLTDRSQLTRLRQPSKAPDLFDYMILAEAAYLSEKHNTLEPTTLFLASTDLAFSPILHRDGSICSDDVTREIQKRHAVLCDWPDCIARSLKAIYN